MSNAPKALPDAVSNEAEQQRDLSRAKMAFRKALLVLALEAKRQSIAMSDVIARAMSELEYRAEPLDAVLADWTASVAAFDRISDHLVSTLAGIDAPRSLGRVAFEAYFAARGGRNHDGSPTPVWESLTDGVRDGWEAAAQAIRASPIA